MQKQISILGCGWLGFPLAKLLLEKNYKVNGSTTNPSKLDFLHKKGIKSFLIELNPELKNVGKFFHAETLIINIPPPRVENKIEYHKKQIESILNEARKSQLKNILFVSSTSVYGNINKEITEEDEINPETESGKALAEVENLLQNEKEINITILRFGGLIGYERNPGNFLAGKTNLKDGNAPVNLIHRDDCISIIYNIIENNIWNETFNACMPEHPVKKDFYTAAALKLNLTPPQFAEDENNSFKIINPTKLINTLNYKFIYSNPMDVLK